VRRSSRRSTRRTSRAAPRSAKGWSPATISRILDNEKYAGRWIWNRTESRRDPKTGRRRRFDKPESEWVINENEELRIVPTQLWETVRERRKTMHRTGPGPQRQSRVLEAIRLELVTPDIGRPFYRAVTTLDALALIEEPPPVGAESGSSSLQRWDSFQMPGGGRLRPVRRGVCTAAGPLVYNLTATHGSGTCSPAGQRVRRFGRDGRFSQSRRSAPSPSTGCSACPLG